MVKSAFSAFLRVASLNAKMHKLHSTSWIWFSKEIWKGTSEGIVAAGTLMKCDKIMQRRTLIEVKQKLYIVKESMVTK